MLSAPSPQAEGLPPSLVASTALGGFLALLLAIYIVFSFNYQTIHALGPSMEPAVSNNDYLLLSKSAYRTGSPERGDIVVFHPSNGQTNAYIKRIIAIPADHLRIQRAQVYINGHQLQENYLREPWTWSSTWNGGSEVAVPPDCYFVLGDNRNHSTDSRFLGYQCRPSFLGKVLYRVFPGGIRKL